MTSVGKLELDEAAGRGTCFRSVGRENDRGLRHEEEKRRWWSEEKLSSWRFSSRQAFIGVSK